MDLFTISQLSRFSGIKQHTIRIWEKRYGALQPERSEGNTRYYSGDQLRRLLNIVSLLHTDHKVSEVSALSDEKLFRMVATQRKGDDSGQAEYFVSQLVSAAMGFNEGYFEKLFSHCLLKYGLPVTYKQVLYPLLARVGLLWSEGSIPPAQEHFLSNLIRQKIMTAIDALPPARASDPWILFLPEGEFHEIGLLFAQYLLRLGGKRCIYLGADVPLSSLKTAVDATHPSALFFFLVHYDSPEVAGDYIEKLKKVFTKKIYLSGNPGLIEQLHTGGKIQWLKSIDELEKIIGH